MSSDLAGHIGVILLISHISASVPIPEEYVGLVFQMSHIFSLSSDSREYLGLVFLAGPTGVALLMTSHSSNWGRPKDVPIQV